MRLQGLHDAPQAVMTSPAPEVSAGPADRVYYLVGQRRSTWRHAASRGLPAGALELRLVLLLDRPAEAKIGDQRPLRWNPQLLRRRNRVEDRNPADAKAARARRQPQRVHREHGGIAQGFRHALAAEAMALGRAFVAEHRQMARRFLEAGELEAGIELRALALIAGEGAGIRGVEVGDDRGAIAGIVDADEAPGLRVADRGREAGEVQQLLDQRLGDRIGAETPHVAPPAQQLLQVIAEAVVELRRTPEGDDLAEHERHAARVWAASTRSTISPMIRHTS